MKLSKLYCNKPELFHPIFFKDGLNVVYAEIQAPDDYKKDTHNLGKTTLCRLIDFCLLKKKHKDFFLFKKNLFKDFVFFLEISLFDGSFITIRRSVNNASRVSFKLHEKAYQDYVNIEDGAWNHPNMNFTQAVKLLDGFLNLETLKNWKFRKQIGYLLRLQPDFEDVFKLKNFQGGHSDWKPFLAQILGFDGELIKRHYELEKELEQKEAKLKTLSSELGEENTDVSVVEGLILLKQQEAEKKQRLLDEFDFREEDFENTRLLVDEIDEKISELNQARYSLQHTRKRIQNSLKEEVILFDPDKAQALFAEVEVNFAGQIKRDFEQLVAFNKAITDERRTYLQNDLEDIEEELQYVSQKLNEYNTRRAKELSFLNEVDVFEKYKKMSNELTKINTDLGILRERKARLQAHSGIRIEIKSAREKVNQAQTAIEQDVERQNTNQSGLFATIRIHFSDVIERVIDHKALLQASVNEAGHIDFKAQILDLDDQPTSADLGNTYRKLMCVAFDFAVLRAHINDKFPRFVYHDGLFESLDDRKKENLLEVVREYSDLGLQPIITLITSDLPSQATSELDVFDEEEIVLRLHDQGDDGRLFKMPAW